MTTGKFHNYPQVNSFKAFTVKWGTHKGRSEGRLVDHPYMGFCESGDSGTWDVEVLLYPKDEKKSTE